MTSLWPRELTVPWAPLSPSTVKRFFFFFSFFFFFFNPLLFFLVTIRSSVCCFIDPACSVPRAVCSRRGIRAADLRRWLRGYKAGACPGLSLSLSVCISFSRLRARSHMPQETPAFFPQSTNIGRFIRYSTQGAFNNMYPLSSHVFAIVLS